MSFLGKKKRFQFNATIEVEELSSIPFINAVLFAKLRLVSGGNFTKYTDRQEVLEHRVRWKCRSRILCKMTASAMTGMLESCVFRVSVRKEQKGGHSYQKLGFVDINLSEYAGAGLMTRRYLLEGYDSKKRLDNSILQVNIEMSLVSGDPVFSVPRSEADSSVLFRDEGYEGSGGGCMGRLDEENKGASGEGSSDSLTNSDNSAFGSLTRKDKQTEVVKCVTPLLTIRQASGGQTSSQSSDASEVISSSSLISQPQQKTAQCKSDSGTTLSTSGALTVRPAHVRQSSDSAVLFNSTRSNRVVLDPSGSMTRNPKKSDSHLSGQLERRVDSTRIDADELVDELFKDADFCVTDNNEYSGLKLVVRKDGTATFG